MVRPYDQAFALLRTACPGEASHIIMEGARNAPPGDEAQVDAWIALGECLHAIVNQVTVH